MTSRPIPSSHPEASLTVLAQRLRSAGCVFAEEEAAILLEAASNEFQLEAFAARREAGEPLEAIVGWVDFGKLRLAVGPGIFVPRQRSRMLAHAAATSALGQSEPLLLEAFCGVAPIAATVARAIRGIEAYVTDIDDMALNYAAETVQDVAGVYPGDVLHGVPKELEGRVTLTRVGAALRSIERC